MNANITHSRWRKQPLNIPWMIYLYPHGYIPLCRQPQTFLMHAEAPHLNIIWDQSGVYRDQRNQQQKHPRKKCTPLENS